jgi:hypothetical protein
MQIEVVQILLAIAVGLGATLVMDLWLLFRKLALKIPPLNYCFIGRWVLHMPEGIFKHNNIALAPQKPCECIVGRIAHYAIGAMFGLALVLLASPHWLQRPTILPSLLWGVVTVAAPFFVMQPAFGLGIAASKTPNPTQARLHNLLTHTVYGLGLYLSAWTASFFLKTHV